MGFSKFIRAFAPGAPVAVPFGTSVTVFTKVKTVPIPSQSGIRIIVADFAVFCSDAVAAANNKLQLNGGYVSAFLGQDDGTGNDLAAVNASVLLANFVAAAMPLSAEVSGNQNGSYCTLTREIYIPAGIIGTGPITHVLFESACDVFNSDGAVNRNVQGSFDVLYRFEAES